MASECVFAEVKSLLGEAAVVSMPARRTGVAAIVAGALIFAGQGGELVFDSPEAVFAVLGVGGFVALAVALWVSAG